MSLDMGDAWAILAGEGMVGDDAPGQSDAVWRWLAAVAPGLVVGAAAKVADDAWTAEVERRLHEAERELDAARAEVDALRANLRRTPPAPLRLVAAPDDDDVDEGGAR